MNLSTFLQLRILILDKQKLPAWRTLKCLWDEVDQHIKDMLEKIIGPSERPWSSVIVLVRKRNGTTRFCVDYRHLNACTIKDTYPLPRILLIRWNSGQKLLLWIYILILASKRKAIILLPPPTTFVTQIGLYQFCFMSFDVANAPTTFERLMKNVMVVFNGTLVSYIWTISSLWLRRVMK